MPRKNNEVQAPPSRPKRAAAPKGFAEESNEDDKDPSLDFLQENMDSGKEDADGRLAPAEKTKPPPKPSARNKQLTAVANHYRKQAATVVEDMDAYMHVLRLCPIARPRPVHRTDTVLVRRDQFIVDHAAEPETDDADALWPATFKAAAQHTRATNEAIAAATRMTSQALAERRAEDIERVSTRLISLHPRRKKAHRHALRDMRRELSRTLEEEKVVADASAMVKAFKTLTRSKKRRIE
ncbi:hypothetical protein OF83DRAFT_1082662 [Amylostereum chailletii]|nr:hypothetical protein OF83DRAFT_1082662 [Amylostereum chailletii]